MSKKIKYREIGGSRRSAQYSSQSSIRNIIDAVVELVTNVEDEYERCNPNSKRYNGKCQIDFIRGTLVNPTILRVKDKGNGMSAEKMDRVLDEHGGNIESDGASRGFFNRGLIDVSALGDVYVYSNHKKKCSIAHIKHNSFEFGMVEKDQSIQNIIFKNPKIQKKNDELIEKKVYKHGTTVEVIIPIKDSKSKIPLMDTFLNQLRQQYQLRYMLATDLKEDYCGTLKLSVNNNIPIQYTHPVSEKIFDEEIDLFPKKGVKVKAHFRVFKTKDFMSDKYTEEFSDYGIIVKGKKAIYEKSFLDLKLGNDAFSKKYYGILQCDYIDELAYEYENLRLKKAQFPSDNPCMIHDGERRKGLSREHPFIKNHLLKEPIKILTDFFKKEASVNGNEINDKDLTDDMNKKMNILAKMCANFSIGNGSKLPIGKWKVIPSTIKIEKGKSETFRVYANKDDDVKIGDEIELSIKDQNKKYLRPISFKSKMSQAPLREEQVVAEFTINGLEEVEKISVPIMLGKGLRTEIGVSVYINKERQFKNEIEFEDENYDVKFQGSKKIKVFAKYPDVCSNNEIEAEINITNNKAIKAPKKCLFKLVPGTNYLISEFNVKGIRKQDVSSISVSISPFKASAEIEVIDKEKKKKGGDFSWEITDKFLGTNVRAQWDPYKEDKLLISYANKYVKYYLGAKDPDSKSYENSKNPIWKMFLNDILADMYSEKLVVMKSIHTPDTFDSLKDINKDAVGETMSEAYKFIIKERNSCIIQLHDADKNSIRF